MQLEPNGFCAVPSLVAPSEGLRVIAARQAEQSQPTP